jgi:hypothetical protein
MRRAALAVIAITLATDADAHCYRIWRYPTPQHCKATALVGPKSAFRLPHAKIDVSLRAAPPARPVSPVPEISIPSLTDIDWGRAPDDELRGRLLLRVILQGKEDR